MLLSWITQSAFVLLVLCTFKCHGHQEEEQLLSRQSRGLPYPLNSCTGILVAIAVPLGLEHRNVFVSYNFEANYNMPTTSKDIVPGPLKRLEYLVEAERSLKGSQTANEVRPEIPSLISRTKIYKLIESKISGLNLSGQNCLLRVICETAAGSFSKHNGVLGDLLHLLLTPSTTPDEGMAKYSEAEVVGRNGGGCQRYKKKCAVNLLDYFTSVL